MKNIEDKKYLKLDILKPNVIEILRQWKNISNNNDIDTMRQNRAI